MKKIIITICLISLSLMIFTGCRKEVSRETIDIKATIVSTEHKAMWIQPIHSGKVTTFITHPERNEVELKYENVSQTINNKDLYTICKDNKGNLIDCKLITIHYDDDTNKAIISIK